MPGVNGPASVVDAEVGVESRLFGLVCLPYTDEGGGELLEPGDVIAVSADRRSALVPSGAGSHVAAIRLEAWADEPSPPAGREPVGLEGYVVQVWPSGEDAP